MSEINVSSAREVKILLDNGWRIQIFKNRLGSYTVCARKKGAKMILTEVWDLDLAMSAIAKKAFDSF